MIADAQRGLAAVRTVRANRRNVLHLPWARFIAIRPARQRSHGANINAHPALFALQVILTVGDNHAVRAAHAHAQRLHVHAFIAYAHAAEAQDATRRLVVHEFRPLFLRPVDFLFHEPAGVRPVAQHTGLQDALAALEPPRAI